MDTHDFLAVQLRLVLRIEIECAPHTMSPVIRMWPRQVIPNSDVFTCELTYTARATSSTRVLEAVSCPPRTLV